MSRIKPGRFFVIEGTDGSGKTAQFELLQKYLKHKRIPFVTVDFPQYGKPSAYFVERYLSGGYGTLAETSPEAASLFYALDRFETGLRIKQWMKEGKVVIANRYVASNLGHQGAKIANGKKREKFMQWVYNIEYGILKIPKPDLNIFLSVPPRISYRLLKERERKTYLSRKGKKDIHEADQKHLTRAFAAYEAAIKMFPKDFAVITCAPNNHLLSLEEIHKKIISLIQKYVNA